MSHPLGGAFVNGTCCPTFYDHVHIITGLFLNCDWSKSPGLILSLSIPHAILFSQRIDHVDLS